MSVKFVPSMFKSFVSQAVAQYPFMKKNKSKQNILCTIIANADLFPRTVQLQKSCKYPKILPVICE